MYVIELSGVQIGKKVRVSHRYKAWPKNKPNEIREGWLAKVNHEPGGEAWVTLVPSEDAVPRGRGYKAYRVPYDSTVEVLN